MVKKLFKHEFLALFRSMLPIECIVLGVGILTRIVAAVENDTTVYDIISGSSIFALIVAAIGGVAAAVIFGILRFYKNLFTQEGYLSLTLPVTASQHIWVKAATAALFQFIAVVVAVISLCIAASGDLLTELFKAAGYILDFVFKNLKPLHISFYIAEFIVLLIISMFYEYLLVYACICIGQRARKHRVLLAFGAYYIYYIIVQVLGTVLSVLLVVLEETLFFEKLLMFFEKHAYGCIHGILIGSIILTALMSFVYFLISRYIMRKKINLE